MSAPLSDPDFLARETLRLIGPDPQNWVPDREGVDHNVLIVGGGQTGSTFTFALRRAGIGRVSVIDSAANEAESGVWLARARMERLRTPKSLPGPELGLPHLSFQAFYESRHGAEAYQRFDRIARTDWADYLNWYRKTLGIAVRYGTELLRVEPAADHFRLHLRTPEGPRVETARKILFGNGVAAAGRPDLPDAVVALPATHLAHTADFIDFSALEGKRIAVLGSAASAFDAAGTALEAGAGEVHLFTRRDKLAATPIGRTKGYPGAYDNYAELPDPARWTQAVRYRRYGSTPPPDSVERATRHSNFHLHLSAGWTSAAVDGAEVVTEINGERLAFDFVIAGTGYLADPTVVPSLADFAADIRLWRDQYAAPLDEQDDALGRHPYLGRGHEYLEKVPGAAPFLRNIHVYNPQGFVSFGLPIGDVPSIRRDVPAVVRCISHDLFFDDWAAHETRITGTVPPEFDESLYAHSVWRGPSQQAAE